jgi:hypothetical protein
MHLDGVSIESETVHRAQDLAQATWRATSLSISGLGSSTALSDLFASARTSSSAKPAGNAATFNDGISVTNDSDNIVQDDTTNYTIGTSVNYLFYQVNAGIQSTSGSFAGVENAIDRYTQSLPTSNVYDSPYTAPSAQFLSDLATLKSDAGAGNLANVKTDIVQAEKDVPLSVAGGADLAIATGDTAGLAALMVEGTENMSDALAAYGATPSAAAAEANAITINGLVGPSNGDAQSVQERLSEIIDVATGLAGSTASSGHGAAPTSSDPMLNVIEDLLQTPSAAASNQTLAQLDKQYGGSSSGATTSSNANSEQTATSTPNLGSYM